MNPVDWLRLFPDADFRFRVGVRQGDARTFFANEDGRVERMRLRGAALAESPEHYAAALPESIAAIREAGAWMLGGELETADCSPEELCIQFGRRIDADWVILSGDAEAHHPVIAGCVCFPSSWSLPAKLGKPVEEVHQPVPTVSEELNAPIHTLLRRLAPRAAWERDNWGLAADAELDHHPAIRIPALDEKALLSSTWLRLERQLLLRLPESSAILFGIKITIHRLDELAAFPSVASRIARALQTMPGSIAAYKGLSSCRETLARQLQSIAQTQGA